MKIMCVFVRLSGPLALKITLPPDYPNVIPHIEIPMRTSILSQSQRQQLIHSLDNTVSQVLYYKG